MREDGFEMTINSRTSRDACRYLPGKSTRRLKISIDFQMKCLRRNGDAQSPAAGIKIYGNWSYYKKQNKLLLKNIFKLRNSGLSAVNVVSTSIYGRICIKAVNEALLRVKKI